MYRIREFNAYANDDIAGYIYIRAAILYQEVVITNACSADLHLYPSPVLYNTRDMFAVLTVIEC